MKFFIKTISTFFASALAILSGIRGDQTQDPVKVVNESKDHSVLQDYLNKMNCKN